jgi:hypothetical protein
MTACGCTEAHERERIVLTGGPGAGKTAVLEMVRHTLCEHVLILPEAATIVFGGGFPRREERESRRAAQRAIFHVQRELEAIGDVPRPAVVLCDRGTVDGLAYWPGPPQDFWAATGTDPRDEFARYDLVVHLRTPIIGYDHANPLRVETAAAAAAIDAHLEKAWRGHPRRVLVEPTGDFLDKARSVVALLLAELPECCSSNLESSLRRQNHPAPPAPPAAPPAAPDSGR